MRVLVTGEQMKAIDAYIIHAIGVPSLVLMERAALKVVQAAERLWKKEDTVWVVCGTGNNGADGVAATRMLRSKGYPVWVFLVGNPDKGAEEPRTQLTIAGNVGLSSLPWQEGKKEECGLLIDTVFSVGLGRPIEGGYRQCIKMLGTKSIRGTVVMDVPSDIHGDTGTVMGIALRADLTVTFGWEKTGTTLYPGREYTGWVEVADTGFPGQALDAAKEAEGTAAGDFAVTYGDDDLKRVPRRSAYSNKGTFEGVLIVAGSRNMCGAAYLSALPAYRTGAGLVKLLTVEENRQVLQKRLPEAIVATYTPDQLMEGRDEFRKMIEAQMEWADVVVLGPGLGNRPYVEYLVEGILTSAFVPVIIGADGLNAITGHPYLTSYYAESIIVTPHLGEMARLTGESVDQIKENLTATALEYAGRYGLTCVLKDTATVTAGRDGNLYISSSGNSAMAKADSDDVLTGIITGLIAIGMDEEEAACLGVYLHGRAGDTAASKSGTHSLLASEPVDAVGDVMAMVQGLFRCANHKIQLRLGRDKGP